MILKALLQSERQTAYGIKRNKDEAHAKEKTQGRARRERRKGGGMKGRHEGKTRKGGGRTESEGRKRKEEKRRAEMEGGKVKVGNERSEGEGHNEGAKA